MANVCPGGPPVANEPVTTTADINVTPNVPQPIYSSNGGPNPSVSWNPTDEFCAFQFTVTPGNQLIVPSQQWNTNWTNPDLTTGNDAGSNPAIAAGFGVAPASGTPVTGPATSGFIAIGTNSVKFTIVSGTIRVSMPNGSLFGYEPGDPVSNAVIKVEWANPITGLNHLYFTNGNNQTPTGITNYQTSASVPAPPPAVTSTPATLVTDTTATLHGTGDSIPPTDFIRIVYGTSPGGPYTTSGPNVPGTNAVGQPISDNATGLTPSTTYYYVVQHLAPDGVTVLQTSNETPFTTTAGPAVPTAVCGGATAVNTNSATLHTTFTGVVAGDQYQIRYGTTPGGPYTTTIGPFPDSTDGPESNPTGAVLSPATNYYFIAELLNSGNTVIATSSECTFTTAAVASVNPQCSGATGIQETQALIHGTVDNMPNTQYARMEVATVSGGPYTQYQSPVVQGNNTVGQSILGNPTGLTPGTIYFVRTAVYNDFAATQFSEASGECPFTTSNPFINCAGGSVTNITTNSADVNGQATGTGFPATGFTYRLQLATVSGGPYVTAPGGASSDGTDPDNFTLSEGALTPSTTYFYRWQIYDFTSTLVHTSPECGSFTTLTPIPPRTAVCGGATSVTATGATLNGTIGGVQAGDTYEFHYGTTPGGPYPTVVGPTAAANGPVSAPVTGLTPLTAYYFVLVVKDSGSVVKATSSQCTFTTQTSPIPPFVLAVADPPSGITPTSATLNGHITGAPLGDTYEIQYGICPATSGGGTSGPQPVSGASPMAVSFAASGLTPNTTYCYNVIVRDSGNNVVSTSNTQQFTTPIVPVIVDPCEPATAITITSATLHGTATNAPAGYSYRFRYSTTPGGPYTSVVPAGVATGASPESYSAALSGLTPGTTYYYVSEVLNPAQQVVATGGECSFATTGATGPGGFVFWCGTIHDSGQCIFVDPGDGQPYFNCNLV